MIASEFEIVDDHRSGKIVVQLNGRLNKTGVISLRYNVPGQPDRELGELAAPSPRLWHHHLGKRAFSVMRG